jgi:hypothetical protein
MSGLDLSTSKSVADRESEGRWVDILDSQGEAYDPPVRMLVAGSYSQHYRKAQDAQRNRLIKQRRTSLTGDAVKQQQLELSAACVLKWEGVLNNGSPVDCTRESVAHMLDACPWITRQVEEAMEDHASFFGSN